KRGRFRPGIADEDIELPELPPELTKHCSDLIRVHHVRLHEKTISSAFTNLSERLYCCTLILEVVDRDIYAALCQSQSNPSPDSARTASDQRVFSIERHMNFLRLQRSSAAAQMCASVLSSRGRRPRSAKISAKGDTLYDHP